MAVNAGAGVPATVPSSVADFDGQQVVALLMKQIGYVEIEGGIAVGVIAHLRSVDPQFRIAIDTVEKQDCAASLRQARRWKALSIPSDTTDHPAGRRLSFTLHPAEGPDCFGAIAFLPDGLSSVGCGLSGKIFDRPIVG